MSGRHINISMKTLIVWGLLLSTFSMPSLAQQSVTQAKPKVLILGAAHSNKAKVSLFKELAGETLDIEHKAESAIKDDMSAAKRLFDEVDLVLFDAVSARESAATYAKYQALITQSNSRFITIQQPQVDSLRKGIDPQQAMDLFAYWDNGGTQNLQRMGQYLQHRLLSPTDTVVEAPLIYPEIGLYHPDFSKQIFADLDSFLSWRKPSEGAPRVGILLQRSLIETAQTQVVDRAIRQLEQQGAVAVPFFFELSPVVSDYRPLISKDGQTYVDLIVSFRNFHWAAKRKAEFEQLGVPVMQALTYYDGDQQTWEQDKQGISIGMTPFTLVLPEGAGVVDPMIVAALNQQTGRVEAIDYQLERLTSKAIKLANLRHKANADKRLTLFMWGSQDVGASFLNIPDSLYHIGERLHQEGYQVAPHNGDYYTQRVNHILDPFYRDYQLDELLQQDLAELMPVQDYLSWFNQLPKSVTEPINAHWGKPQDNFMAVKRDGVDYFVLPRIRNGNLLIMRQPPRSDKKDNESDIYHVGTVPINHFYLAAYYYAREYWHSDAIIHLGTHGSQEYLGGKERGLSIFDQGNLAVWDTPVVYPFIVDDVGEAMQTKRRGRATVISHMTAPFAAAGLQGVMADIHELMHQYDSLDEGGVKLRTGEQIHQRCIEENICADFGWSDPQIKADFDGFIQALHEHLKEIAGTNQPLGLHSFGMLPEQALLTTTLVQMQGQDFIQQALAFERKHYQAHQAVHDGDNQAMTDEVALENTPGFKLMHDYVVALDGSKSVPLPVAFEKLDDTLQSQLLKAREQYQAMQGIAELDNLIGFLQGRYVPVKTGGDPIRHPESVPTGFNLQGFDPARVPTQAAWEQGKALTEELIADYYQEHGRYPDKLAFSLWSIETMRHYGVLESQALYAMGVRPTWTPDGRVTGTEVIPYSELKRPRVDVVLSATGLYRDAFPNVMQLLAKAVQQVAELQEQGNSIWANSQRIGKQLVEQGVAPDEAEYLSTMRLFSNASGDYGSGVDGAAWASDSWEQDSKIADLYLDKMGYFFGPDDKRWGEKLDGINLYAQQLSGTDVALFARSSNLFGMLSSDDPFEYFGSLSLAVRNIDGKSPQMRISNLRNASSAKTEKADQFLAKELRTRVFHKRWIQEMQKEGYSGAVGMSSRMDNFWGWQVVDPDIIRDDQWQEYFDVYVNDKLDLELDKWFEQTNPAALARMLERMLEANRKDYWEADAHTLQTLVERYIDLVNQHELYQDNDKLRDFVNQSASGFGLIKQLAAPMPLEASLSEAVQGQKLEKVQASEQPIDWNWTLIWSCLAMLLLMVAGMLWQGRPPRPQLRLSL
ncbi:cobaltochelatase subunit CobN [Bowmanella denitrificans]|uniref:Cobaltochelatase subunit CobN n=2 Tax=Bowmanella denitrificans TaxID=366582 RepID=A0ABP3HJ25_9ALTE